VDEAPLDFKLAGLARAIDQRHVEAKLVRRGLAVEIVPGQSGRRLARDAAAPRIVRALARLERGQPIALPVRLDPVDVTEADLAPAAAQARTALSAPVRLEYEGTRWKLPRWRIAELLSLPVAGTTDVAIAGPGAEAWFAKLRKTVERPPADATFRPVGDGIEIVPAKDGLAVDVPATAKALLAAAVSTGERSATLVVRTAEAERTTAEAQALGIERRLSSYTTLYAGTPDRITNLQLGVSLLNGALVAPGATFSFNDRVGERTIERGFRPAPVIIKDEYDEDVGGGVSQVATTVFNAAWEAGLKIAERNPHSLYISRYQLGRDATVNYPDLDLKFVNDTPKWIFVGGASGGVGITVSIYGGGPERRVESGTGSIRETGPAPIRRVKDPTLLKGETTVEEEGSPARATAVTRKVYDEEGTLLHDETWNTSYRGEYRIIRVGTKPPPKPKTKPKAETPAPPPTQTEPATTLP
jgi:vancomycin resistance protein YoaR